LHSLADFAGVVAGFLNAGIMGLIQVFKGGCMISKILVPSDGSKAAQKAAAYAVDLAKQLKASVIVLSVIDKRSFMPPQTVPAAKTARHAIEPIEDYLREAAEVYAGEIKKLCDESGVALKISIKTGHPVEEIVKEAKKSKANLIVMGSHGRSALSATVLGSVSYGVIHKDTTIPVLIVKG
jgi:nucleotide-binding universal stress UspA family protein